jgi:hypothetical protein
MAIRSAGRHPRGVKFCGPRSLVGVCVALATAAAVLALSSAQAPGARSDQTPCTWGASSVSATLVDGHDDVSPVATSGCVPTK